MKKFNFRLILLTIAICIGVIFSAFAQGGTGGEQYTWNGSISSDWDNLNNWTPNGIPTGTSEITIPLVVNLPSITGVKTINDLTINSGASMEIPLGATLNVNGDIHMYSESNSYASLIVNGTIAVTGTAKYHRFTNSQSNGNDLIAPPLVGQTWSSFLTSDTNYNEGLIFNNGVQPMTTYLFGPFEKAGTDDYVLYKDDSIELLVSGTGYRVATNTGNGEALIFTGTIATGIVTSTIVNDITGDFSEWNLIGNPYPAYIEVGAFLNHIGSVSEVTNLSLLSDTTAAIYGYSADTSGSGKWTVLNLATGSTLIAPGQGFFVSSNLPIANLEFTPDMQVLGNADDFIQGRSSETTDYIHLRMHSAVNSSSTSIYFNANATNGLDVGYDAAVFGGDVSNFKLYSHLVQDNTGLPMSIQTLNTDFGNNVTIPLGVDVSQGEQITFSLEDFDLPDSIDVYIEDNLTGTSTLLNTSSYTITTATAINGTGRFLLHFTTNTLSEEDHIHNALSIYSNPSESTILVEGVLADVTQAAVYDLFGRIVLQKDLDASLNRNVINATKLSPGVYVVGLQNGKQSVSQKVLLK
ncbi:T9SS type A sorting domain-containing protein [Winogradskyella pulchriflava]|uniref:T9SS type A sorting domain-containing protein n=1 Tax=Winogradskyella pulchriflava TaxID=1110688 RepID=A0ABV6QCA7_9FLAO